jgi:hypothetical protein
VSARVGEVLGIVGEARPDRPLLLFTAVHLHKENEPAHFTRIGTGLIDLLPKKFAERSSQNFPWQDVKVNGVRDLACLACISHTRSTATGCGPNGPRAGCARASKDRGTGAGGTPAVRQQTRCGSRGFRICPRRTAAVPPPDRGRPARFSTPAPLQRFQRHTVRQAIGRSNKITDLFPERREVTIPLTGKTIGQLIRCLGVAFNPHSSYPFHCDGLRPEWPPGRMCRYRSAGTALRKIRPAP